MHRRAIQQAIFHNVEHTSPIARTIESKMRALIHHKSFELVKGKAKCIDIVKDVVNLAPIHWIADALVSPWFVLGSSSLLMCNAGSPTQDA